MSYEQLYTPGYLEVFCGPMKSGKTLELIHRINKLEYRDDVNFVFFKPSIDTRDKTIKSRFETKIFECVFVKENDFNDLFNNYKGEEVVAIDEAHFFEKEVLIKFVNYLLKNNKNVLIAGLELDFRGEPFGAMPEIICMADKIYKLSGICDVKGCNNIARMTQRLVNGKPAHYSSPLILIGDAEEGYETRCRKHHAVKRD